MTDTQGFRTPPTLDGLHLTNVDPASVDVGDAPIAGLLVMADGTSREQIRYSGPGLPEVTRHYRFELDYRHLGSHTVEIEKLLAFGGAHVVIVWKHVTLGYRGDGARTEWILPWKQALHESAPPRGHDVARFRPTVELEDLALTPVDVDGATYDGGSPPVGQVWFREGSRVFKLATAPGAGAKLVVRVVPAFRMVCGPSASRRYTDPIREPRKLVFEETS